MGDLLIVMRNDDLGHVEPTALRMAASELASTSRYSLMMDEVRHSTSATMFHEACLSWLGGNEGKESQESLRYHERWQQFNQFLVVGNFLQFELLHNELDAVPKPRFLFPFYHFCHLYSIISGVAGLVEERSVKPVLRLTTRLFMIW